MPSFHRLLAALTGLLILPGCTEVRALSAYLQSPDDLPAVQAIAPMHAEPGAEDLAGELVAALPEAVAVIESTHGAKFAGLPTVVACATDACYRRYAAVPQAAAETQINGRIVVNGAKLRRDDRNARAILTHELSHYFWSERGIRFQPRWFEEGLAVWASGGGGAEKVSVEEACRAIAAGASLRPVPDGGYWAYRTQRAADFGIGWPMFYRQAGMFVEYLHDSDPEGFARLLSELRQSGNLKEAWRRTYAEDVAAAWGRFVLENAQCG